MAVVNQFGNTSEFKHFFHLDAETNFDLMLTFQVLHREIGLLEEKSYLLESHLLDYYEKNPGSKIKPQILCVVLIHYFSRTLGSVGIKQICKIFQIDYGWFRRKRRDYLTRLGIFDADTDKNSLLGRSYRHEWRLTASLGI